MGSLRRACMWMDMNVTMLSSIARALLRDGSNTKGTFTYGTTMGTCFHCQRDSLLLVPLADSASSSSPTMSPHSFRMTCKNLAGLTKVIHQLHPPKVMDNQSQW